MSIFFTLWAMFCASPDAHAVALDGLGQDHGRLALCGATAAW